MDQYPTDNIQKKKDKYFVNQYKWKQFKPQFASAFLNGTIFGIVYSFYYMPIEFRKQQIRIKYRHSKLFYTGSGMIRCGLAFGILRCVYSFAEYNQFSYGATCAILGSTIAGVAMYLL